MEKFNFQEAFQENLKYISSKEISPSLIESQFVRTNTRFYLKVGEIDVKSGNIVVCDPLCYLQSGYFSPIIENKIPKGTYSVEVALFRNEHIGIKMCTTKLKIKETKAKKYVRSLNIGNVKADEKKFLERGFPVDAGMMCFVDEEVAREYIAFIDKWYEENKGKNIYDDYFAYFFKESEKRLPAYQREGGDFICWTNPMTNSKIVMVASGLGDGYYQSYYGYDENDEICDIIVPMINPDIFER